MPNASKGIGAAHHRVHRADHGRELAAGKARGYRGDEWVGATGLEAWGEPYLAGKHGGMLSVLSPKGDVVKVVADQEAAPSRSLYTSINRKMQEAADQLIAGHTGAIVVLKPKTGEIMALSSYPSFNPNTLIARIPLARPSSSPFSIELPRALIRPVLRSSR